MNNLKIKNNTIISLFIIIVIGFFSFAFIGNKYFASLLFVFLFLFIMSIKDYENHPFFVCYLLSFFVFLIGRPLAIEIFNFSKKYAIRFNENIQNTTYVYLIISLVSLYLGFIVFSKISRSTKIKKEVDNEKVNELFIHNVLKVSRLLSIILYLLVIVENLFRYIFVKNIGYTNSYIFESKYTLPFGLHYLVEIAPIAICLFLASFPSKKEAKLPLILFLLANLIFAFSGNRFEILSSFMLVIIYFLIRNKTDTEVWIKKKNIVTIICLIPIIILIMQFMIYWREGTSVNNVDNPYLSFLYGVGGSADLISATEQYSDSVLSDNVLYSFGNLWRSLHGNIIAKILGIHVQYQSQTVEAALKGHSLSSALTYFLYPKRYLAGYGLGGCYIAELLHDFKVLGIIIGNFLIGVFIGLFNKVVKKRVFYNFICIFAISLILRLPRDSFDYVLTEFIGIKNILAFIIIVLFARQLTIRQKKK